MIVVTAEEMREMDRLTIQKYGVPSVNLMERAGAGIAQALVGRFGAIAKKGVLVVAGKGNNGGDGFVVARLLKKKRIPCEVALLARGQELSLDAAHNLKAFLKLKGKVTEINGAHPQRLDQRIGANAVIVDAILGTGMRNEVRGLFADAIASMNRSGLPIVAVDIPSGLDSDRGTELGVAVQAKMTVALAYPKLGEVIYPGVKSVGELVVADIGIAPAAVAEVAPKIALLERQNIAMLVPRREPDSHKGTYGHLLIVAGSRGKTGAAVLASRAAMRTGAGLVTLAAPAALNNILAGALVEVMTEALGDKHSENIEILNDDEWRSLLDRKAALLFGPGIGVSAATQTGLRWLLRNLQIPWVIDADGLNNLALETERLRHARSAPILTPHPGEMARLTGKTTAAVNGDRVEIARRFAVEHRCHLVLKGARTVIATQDGKIFINPTGNAGMASGGMGDVLAGILSALLGQGLTPEDAMKLGVYLHGLVGDQLASSRGQIGLIASDIIDGLPSTMQELSNEALRPTSS